MTDQEQNKESEKSKVSFFPIHTAESDNWPGAFREFFKQLGSVASLLIIVLTLGQCTGFLDIYRLLDK